MTLRWLICFSLASLMLDAATVSGRVELRDSRDPAVRNRKDFSGVVIALKPLDSTLPPAGDKHAVMLQKDKTFSPHVLAVEAGSVGDFANGDPSFHDGFFCYRGQVFH